MSCISDPLALDVGGMKLKVPVVIASGTWAYEAGMWADDLTRHVGAICSKAITKDPCPGNPGYRIWETPSGVLNSIGLQNEGIDRFIDCRLPDLKKRGVPVMLNVCMQSAEDLAYMMDRIAEAGDMVDGVELNVSCPNTDHGCMSWGVDPALTAQATEMARRRWDGPLWVKLTPQAPDIPAVAKAAESAGASAVVAANTWLGMAIDTLRGVPVFSRRVAGLSGPAVFPLALRVVWDAAGAVKIPVIGCGGVDGPDSALAMIMAGASAVEVGAALFGDFKVLENVHEGLLAAVERWNVASLAELIGRARRA
ncbi:dihydroorotate dehydrogenase [Pyramidobacter sp. C12-8]|uniref:dihydroorotate dehydrogenase n=1 Tax=Pyramidobacter sp. C12-8 TaxID=1943580 RepID=UPI00098F9A85|nr:dihydroorotate dehydrogenase [Pyramidobacter sp. C12-8]OON89483.1 dihydroorotate dehydrogenase B catalytic subunit [Pyramidobacter sp. C12-8]